MKRSPYFLMIKAWKYQVNRQAFRYLNLCASLFRDLKNIKHSSTGKRKTKMA